MRWFSICLCLVVAPFAVGEVTPEQEAFFESKIRPVLIDACYECHSKSEGKSKGGLTLDTAIGLRQGGNSGVGVGESGDLEESWIWAALSHADPDIAMPPKSDQLPEDILEDFRVWIEMGAPDPRSDDSPHVVTSEIDVDAGRASHWAFQKPVRNPDPAVGVDHLVSAARAEQGLDPNPSANPADLIRRIAFDVIGLPPTPEAVEQFTRAYADSPITAIEAMVDRLLATPQFGERWGRHWLDVARYAETNGKETNFTYPHAWRYRDYVIDAFNADLPYDEFLRQQIAGDLLKIDSDEEFQRNLIATGFLTLGAKNLKDANARQFAADLVDEQIDTTFQATLGLTVACARCHDHKTDPIPTEDYYALAGVFHNTETLYGAVGAKRNTTRLLPLPIPDGEAEVMTPEEIAALREELAGWEATARELRSKKGEGEERMRLSPLRDRIKIATAKLASLEQGGAVATYAMMTQDVDSPSDVAVLVRGEVDSPAQTVPRGFLQVLNHAAGEVGEDQSGRLQLAAWIASEENPLTARVWVNRVWQQLFGRGLVVTTNNFGVGGKAPVHPELLDFLAISFVESGWSVKSLIREIILTQTYQQSSSYRDDAFQSDPENVYLWRQSPRRLDAEAFRDAILSVSGQLDYNRPIGSPIADLGPVEMGRKSSPEIDMESPRYRSIYLPLVRDHLPEMLELFDAPDTNASNGTREISNVATQSLYLMNNPFVIEAADAFASSLADDSDDLSVQVRTAFDRAFSRSPTESELSASRSFFSEFSDLETDRDLALSTFCQSLLLSAEFRYLQ